MRTPSGPGDGEDLPLSCTVCLSEEGVIGRGTVRAFYHESCHIQSALRVRPGMLVTISIQFSGGARLKLKPGFVTWARRSEFGLRFLHSPATTHEERSRS